MNVAAAILLQSIPFAGVATASSGRSADPIVALNVVAFGLLLSLIVSSGDHGTLMKTIAVIGLID